MSSTAVSVDEALPLQCLYLHLVRAGFELSVRDYEDALRALRLGHGIGSREALQVLCINLWARGDEEVVRLQGVFKRFARPRRDEIDRLVGAGGPTGAAAQPEAPADAAAQIAAKAQGAAAGAPRAEFAVAGDSGMALPSVRLQGRVNDSYVFEGRPPVALRTLVIAWRRYRVARRSGPPVELDIEATVAAQCRTGWLLEPVRLPARRNEARLLVLVDASASMVAWRGLHEPLAESLQQGRLKQARLLYFENDPRMGLFESAAMHRPLDWKDVLGEHGDAAVLVMGDAGAARGLRDRQRLAGTREFVGRVVNQGSRLAWLNPMPRERWGDAARPLRPSAVMHELNEDGLTRAVDFLRGMRDA
ncbi:VWA domain-containing protein [Variovorax sp. J22R115]|uniref:VWA domain-containing protein n=1 Tax=Variovorax sp. J22R115 TaxID=3053509 RepID=UPI0025780D34|nr:VWA domain-containing protein [Variovorax sp. J22R115]MDM0048611.1 VWA domain-containing protein [Variovorax sp. J22R115]